nr:uncharacterized protein LOC109192285 [Ipomoea batatas]
MGSFIRMDDVNMNGIWKPFMRVRVSRVTKETVRPFSVELRATGRRSQPNQGQKWLLQELPRKSTNAVISEPSFSHDSHPQEQGEGSSKNDGAESGHYPEENMQQVDLEAEALLEKQKSLDTQLMLNTTESNSMVSHCVYGPTLVDPRKRKLGRTEAELTTESHMRSILTASAWVSVGFLRDDNGQFVAAESILGKGVFTSKEVKQLLLGKL